MARMAFRKFVAVLLLAVAVLLVAVAVLLVTVARTYVQISQIHQLSYKNI